MGAPGVRPLASVVVNNFNYARYLPAAIDSALAQSWTPLEVIVVDDGSTDGSRGVVEGYGDRVTAIFQPNGGQAAAFNAGFAAARGDVVLFLDADDVLLPHAVERALERFGPGVVKVHWPVTEIDARGAPTGVVRPERGLGEGDLRARAIAEGPLAGNAPPTSGNLWSRAFLERVLPMPEEAYRINADGYLLTLSWIYGSVRALAEPNTLYRVHGANRFVSLPPGERWQRHLDKFVHHCEALAEHLRAQGVEPWPEIWRRRKGLFDPQIAAVARAAIAEVVPPGARFALAGDPAWANGSAPDGALADRRVLPFLGRAGRAWSRPEHAEEAIGEVARLRAEGADFLVLPWSTWWWLEHHPDFDRHLWVHFRCVLWNDFVGVFDLRSPPDPAGADEGGTEGVHDPVRTALAPAVAGPPLASVVVNNHNYGRYLGDAIASALAQTYAPLEVVVVDDGSSDDSRAVIAGFGDRVVAVLKENGGQGSALNAGFAAAKGDVVVFLDADDLLHPDVVARAVDALADPAVAKAHWPLHEVDGAGARTGRVLPAEPLPEGDLAEATLRDGPGATVSPPTSGNAWARRFLERVLPMPEAAYRIGADAYLFGLAPAFGRVARLEEPLASYRIHGRNNYWGSTFEGRLRTGHRAVVEQWRALERHCAVEGVPVDRAGWERGSYFHRLHAAVVELEAVVPPGETFVLIDDEGWGTDRSVRGRPRIPFLERDGAYHGRPADDAVALAELERLRRERGVRWLVVGWPAFWWLEHYAGFAAHLRAHRCTFASERLVAFDLGAPETA